MSARGTARGTASPGCLLSGACARALGTDEDSPNLSLLALFRTAYVARLPEGPEVLAEHAAADRRLAAAVGTLAPGLAAVVWAYVHDRLEEAASLVRRWRFEEAHELLSELRMTLEAALLEDAETPVAGPLRAHHRPHCPRRASRAHPHAPNNPSAPPRGATR